MTGGYRDVDTDDYDPRWDEDDDPDGYDDDWYEPDISDYEEQRAEEEYREHRDQAHGGKECDCRAPLADRIRDCFRSARRRVRAVLRRTRYSDEPPF